MPAGVPPILVINNGSSSLKFSVLDPKAEVVLSSGLAERIGMEKGLLKLTDLEQASHQEKLVHADHRSALLRVIEILSKRGQFDCRAIGQSGLLGVSGVSHDMRSVIAAADNGNARAKLAIDVFCHRLGRAILGLASSLTSIDAVIFTGGIGENSALARSKVLSHLAILYPEIDPKLNDQNGKNSDGRITTGTGLLCLVIPTNEELMIARETDRLVS